MRALSVKVVGVSFENRQEDVKLLREGDPVLLIKEPSNLYDKNAIKVMTSPTEGSSKGSRALGYIPRDLAGVMCKCFADRMVGVVQSVGESAYSGLYGLVVLLELQE